MSGTDENARYADAVERLEGVLDRRVPMAPLPALTQAMSNSPAQEIDLSKIAIGFDSSVFLRLANDPKSADILDYLPRHNAPLILPGQAIQEFWNNQVSVMHTLSKSMKKSFDQLAKDVNKLDAQFSEFEQQMIDMLDSFELQYGYAYDENTRGKVARMLSILEERADCYFVPRCRFKRIAEIRNRTKTPPGFKDDGDGDFFVWADFLFSLLMCNSGESNKDFDQVVLLTNDQKPDWSISGTPHPILSAEIGALFKTPFYLWDLKFFGSQVERALQH
jgi:hypothetical protein